MNPGHDCTLFTHYSPGLKTASPNNHALTPTSYFELYATWQFMDSCGSVSSQFPASTFHQLMSSSIIRTIHILQEYPLRLTPWTTLHLGATNHHPICPVAGTLPYLALRGNTSGPLFLTEKGQGLTVQDLSASLDFMLTKLQLQPCNYNTYTFGLVQLHRQFKQTFQTSASRIQTADKLTPTNNM